MASADQEESSEEVLSRACKWFRAFPEIVKFAEKTKKLGKDDPRRIVHSLKVGLALTLVSSFCYCKPLFDGFGVNAMWAVLPVVLSSNFLSVRSQTTL